MTAPIVDGAKTVLFCAWLAWSRFRVIIPIVDRTMPSVVAALDQTFRLIGGASTYVLTDNEKTVTDRHIAGIAVRNETMVAVSNYYGVTICTCVPYDPESKGGSESTVKIAKADLVPTEANLLDEYRSFAELEEACTTAMATFNGRVQSVTRRVPSEALQENCPSCTDSPTPPTRPRSVSRAGSDGPRSSLIEALATRCPTPTVTPGSGSARSATR